ncbi:MAG: ATP-dependent RNA helicase HrpA [Proteobacteria bacterium]|nr:ATP-dependent RNA helicase HrpA [Pseudomonadota bacterium]MBU1715084.1 ATP-dependent RNA helicase HrpA [Pseudomonadota bacterium]
MVKQINYPAILPITAQKDLIIKTIRENQVLIVVGDTGSGKSTQLGKMCLEAGRGRKRMIGCTQPRRIAATSVAARVAEEMGAEGPALVGYKVRFNDHTSKSTRIKFMTDGILLAETRRDRDLLAYDTIIVDEAHERSLNIDFLLGILHGLLARRHDLKLIVTSATIDTDKFSAAFKGAPVIKVSGRTFPVEVRYRPPEVETEGLDDSTYVEHAVQTVLELRAEDSHGDMLVFMPTERDIREMVELLSKAVNNGAGGVKGRATREAVILPLFGRLSARDQNRIFRPVNGQKIVVATNVAETSVTVPGIRYVIDTGRARIPSYNPRARTSKMPVSPISRASADQRHGRCGRVGPGICVRLYSEEDYLGRQEFTRPEIQRSNLADVILRMIHLKLVDPVSFPFIDPPAARAITDGYNLLLELDAIFIPGGDRTAARLTKHGQLMAHLPLDPRISRMIIEARNWGSLSEITIIAAALSIADPRIRPADRQKEADAAHAIFIDQQSDFISFLNIWRQCEKLPSTAKLSKFCRKNFLAFQRIREWRDIHEQISLILAEEHGFTFNSEPAGYEAIHRPILSGNLRNIGLRKSKNVYQGGQGKELMVFPGSGLFNRAGKWIMAAELVETSRLYARCLAVIKPEWIEPLAGSLCRYSYHEPHWEKKRGQVVAFRNTTLFGLLIEAKRRINFGLINPDEAREIFIQTGLIEGELLGDYRFMAHNQRLLERLQGMEDRVRQRDIMVDDHTLFTFYDERLGPDIFDRAGLNRFLKNRAAAESLMMAESDLLLQSPEPQLLADFPEQIEVDGLSFKLSYKFEPGAVDDGISVMVPVELVSEIKPELFEWLVPGLLPEKVVLMLKGLPKMIRRQLVPIPQTSEQLLRVLVPGRGRFLAALQEAVFKENGVRIEYGQWPKDNLPPHLIVRFCLIDRQGKVLKASRDFRELAGRVTAEVPSARQFLSLKDKWEKEGLSDWAFEGLPDRIPVKDEGHELSGFAYPGLADEGDNGLALRLYVSEEERRRATRKGLLLLYSPYFNKFKGLKKDFSLGSDYWALYEGLAGQKEINSALLNYILEEIFDARLGVLPDRQSFETKISEVKKAGIFALGRKIMDQVVELLKERRATLDLIGRFAAMADTGKENSGRFEEYRQQVKEMVPVDFLQVFDRRRMALVPRYLKALQIRVERAHVSPARDLARAEAVAPYIEKLHSVNKNELLSLDGQRLLTEFQEMVEEFKISIFAQEIKTAFPVSAKRLDKKWQEFQYC